MEKRILSFFMSAVLTASFLVSPCTHAFNIEKECGEVVVTVIDEETGELFKESGKFGMTMVDDKWDASESNPYTVKNVPKNDAYCITYDPDYTKDDDYCYAIDGEKTIPLFYLNADEDAKDITIYMQKRPIENKAEYGTVIVTVIDEETNELFREDGVDDDVNFWIMGSSAEGQSSFGFGGTSFNQFNSNISNPFTLNNALVNERYKITHLGYNYDGFTYMIDEEKSEDDFVYSGTEPKEVKIYMKKDIWADHKADTQASEQDTSEYGTVTVTVIDKETNELFKEHSKFGLMMADDDLTVLDDKWDASENNPYTIKNVPKDNKFFITYDNDFMRYDSYYYRIYDYRSFKFDKGEDTKNLTIYMEKRPVEIKPEYGTVTVSVINEETGELYYDENDITSVSFFKTPLDFPKEGQFGGTIQIDEWNIGQSNPHVIEQVETNYSYTLNYSMMFFNTQYAVDAEKIPETPFDYLSSEPKEIKLYIKKSVLADQKLPKQMTLDDVVALSKKDGELTWADFEDHSGRKCGTPFDMLAYIYEIDEGYYLFVSGAVDRAPDQVQLCRYNEHISVDIFTGDVEAFIAENSDYELPDLGYTFDKIYNMTEDGVRNVFKEKGLTDTEKYHVYPQRTGKSAANDSMTVLLYPENYMINLTDHELVSHVTDMNDRDKLFQDSDIVWDREKVRKSLGLPKEYFDVYVESSMTVIKSAPEGEDPDVRKYCKCSIRCISKDTESIADLRLAALNYVQLNPDFALVYHETSGGENVSTPEKNLKGDANCDDQVDLSDAVMIMQALANPNKYGIDGTAEHHLTEQGKINGDMDGDGITVGDAQAIQRKLLGLPADKEVQSAGDYPCAIKVSGTVYWKTNESFSGDLSDYTVNKVTAYSENGTPQNDGESNFDRKCSTEYIILDEDRIAVKMQQGEVGCWIFKAKD